MLAKSTRAGLSRFFFPADVGIRAYKVTGVQTCALPILLAGGAAMLGHWRPLFLRFARGGKVVATCGGAFLGVAPLVGGVGLAVWLLVFALLRYASVEVGRASCRERD